MTRRQHFLTAAKGTGVYKLSENLNKYDDIIAISINKDIEKRVSDMMVSLEFISLFWSLDVQERWHLSFSSIWVIST